MVQLQYLSKMRVMLLLVIGVIAFSTGCQKSQGSGQESKLSPKVNSGKNHVVAFVRLTGSYWQVWTMDPKAQSFRQITNSSYDKRYPIWSKDGKSLFYRSNNSTLYQVDLESKQEKQILPEMGLCGALLPNPQEDLYLLMRHKSQIRDTADLWLIDLEGQDKKIITKGLLLNYDPAWSPDGKAIAYISSEGYRTSELYVMDQDGENRQRMTENTAIETTPAFSPDGEHIAFASDRTGDFEIWMIDSNGNHPVQLTNAEGRDTCPSWSPDAEILIFASNRSGVFQLWQMDKDGVNQKQLTNEAASMDPAWRKE